MAMITTADQPTTSTTATTTNNSRSLAGAITGEAADLFRAFDGDRIAVEPEVTPCSISACCSTLMVPSPAR